MKLCLKRVYPKKISGALVVINLWTWYKVDQSGFNNDACIKPDVQMAAKGSKPCFTRDTEKMIKTLKEFMDSGVSVLYRQISPQHFNTPTGQKVYAFQFNQPIKDKSCNMLPPKSLLQKDWSNWTTEKMDAAGIDVLKTFKATYHTAKQHISEEDCNLWCQPGVPGLWNQIWYTALVKQDETV